MSGDCAWRDRRALLRLVLYGAPALAVTVAPGIAGAMRAAGAPANRKADSDFRFFSATDGIHWSGHGCTALLLPLGRHFALRAVAFHPVAHALAYTALDRHTGLTLWQVAIDLRHAQPTAGIPTALASADLSGWQPLAR